MKDTKYVMYEEQIWEVTSEKIQDYIGCGMSKPWSDWEYSLKRFINDDFYETTSVRSSLCKQVYKKEE